MTAVRKAVRELRDLGCARLYKKIDSTMRGHVGAEIVAMMRETNAKTSFVCPAFPAMGRIIQQGIAYAGGRPLSDTQEGREVFKNLPSTTLTGLLSTQSGLKAGLIDASWYARGSDVTDRISQLIEEDCGLVVFDATREEHLSRIIEVTEPWKNESILAGSAGLASALAVSLEKSENNARIPEPRSFQRGPVVLVSGSLNTVTQTQLNALNNVENLDHVPIDATSILDFESSMISETRRVIQNAQTALKANRDVCIYWGNPDALEAAILAEPNINRIVERINAAIESIMTALAASTNIGGLILVGGETACAVLNALGVDAIELHHQVLEGVPFGAMIGGMVNGKSLITKAGGFGNEATLINALDFARHSGNS
jgi:uncharacterized protein YgbK (DUF1537 family)